MKLRIAIAIVAVGVLLAPRVSVAAEITEAEFLALLSEDHPAVVALMDELAVAEGEREAPRTGNPGVSVEREAPRDAASETTVKLSWRPPLDGRRGPANRAAEAGLAAAGKRLEWRKLLLRGERRELFARWWLAVERQDLLANLTRHVDRLAARVRTRASSGEESGLDARRLELAAAQTRTGRARAEADALRLHAELRALHPDLDVSRRPVRPSLPTLDASLDVIARADLQAARHDVERAEAERQLAGRTLEFPSLVGGWKVVDEDPERIDGPVFGLEWDLPLFDRDQGERARTSREADVARARLQLARARAAAELRASQEVYESLRASAAAVLEATDGTDVVIEAATAELQAGESTLTDLLETVRSVTDSRLAALELHHEALAAHRDLERSAGRPLTGGDSP